MIAFCACSGGFAFPETQIVFFFLNKKPISRGETFTGRRQNLRHLGRFENATHRATTVVGAHRVRSSAVRIILWGTPPVVRNS